jgi:hypothetical protein
MAQLNFYVPDDTEAEVRRRAKAQGVSISAYLAALLKEELGAQNNWPTGFFENIVGSWQGDFPDIDDHPPQERDWTT